MTRSIRSVVDVLLNKNAYQRAPRKMLMAPAPPVSLPPVVAASRKVSDVAVEAALDDWFAAADAPVAIKVEDDFDTLNAGLEITGPEPAALKGCATEDEEIFAAFEEPIPVAQRFSAVDDEEIFRAFEEPVIPAAAPSQPASFEKTLKNLDDLTDAFYRMKRVCEQIQTAAR